MKWFHNIQTYNAIFLKILSNFVIENIIKSKQNSFETLWHIFGIVGKDLNEEDFMKMISLFLDLRCKIY
jgi:hypothetical protein